MRNNNHRKNLLKDRALSLFEINEKVKVELQKKRDDEINYKDYLRGLFKFYRDSVNQLSDRSFDEDLPEGISRGYLANEIRKCTNALLRAYNSYMEGKLSTAITIMTNKFLTDDFLQTYTLDSNQTWFRARIKGEGKNGFEPQSMFHIPFEMRTNVVNYRYSISGHPCLYFGSTILSCWEEMHCPALDDLVVSRLSVRDDSSVQVVDLRFPEKDMEGDKQKRNLKLLMTWPLIIACSIKTITPNAPFKFEYIHPQLLMLALKEKNGCWGVAYTSTHIDTNMSTELSDYTNIAISVRCIKEKGYCDELAKNIHVSRGISFIEAELKNVLDSSNNVSYDNNTGELCIQTFENGTMCYRETKFGKLETYLNKYIQPESIQ